MSSRNVPSARLDYSTRDYERGQRASRESMMPQPRRMASDVVQSRFNPPYPRNEDVLEYEAFTDGSGNIAKEISIYANGHHATPVHVEYKSYPIYFNSQFRIPSSRADELGFQGIVKRSALNVGVFFYDEPKHILEMRPSSFSIPANDRFGNPIDTTFNEVHLTIIEWVYAGYANSNFDFHHFSFTPSVVGQRIILTPQIPTFRFNRAQMNAETLTLRFSTPINAIELPTDVLFSAQSQPTNPMILTYPDHGLLAGEIITVYNEKRQISSQPVTVIDANTISIPYNAIGVAPTSFNIAINRNLVTGHIEFRGGPSRT
jgi:hypothetical protein